MRSKQSTFRHRAAIVFALTSILPLLLFLLVVTRHDLFLKMEVQLLLGLSLLIVVLGLATFWKLGNQITYLVEEFLRVERGEIEEVEKADAPREISELVSLAEGFNRILVDLKENTKELEGLVYKLSTLNELTELVSRIPEIEMVLETVLHRTMTALNAGIGSIMLLEPETRSLRIVASRGLEDSIIEETRIPLGEGISGRVAQTGQPVLVENVESDDRFPKANHPKYETPSFICMPLKARERIIGVLNLSKKGDRKNFGETDLKFLNTLLSHISFAVENARLFKEAREYARKLQELLRERSLQLDQAQQQVLQAARLSTLGEIVAGVAHELNNPLTCIMGYAEMLGAEAADDRSRQGLKTIYGAGEQAAKIVKNLLSFARQTPPEKHLADLNETVSGILQMCAFDLQGGNIQVVTDMAADLPIILADTRQLQQVFLNIVNNAQQAMAEMTENHLPKRLTIRTSHDDKRLKLFFSDTGPGIPPDMIGRVFDPFFTTKAPGKGTGLGLSISYGIIRSHDGDLSVRSVPGEGTTFVIELPLDSKAPEASHGIRPPAAEVEGLALRHVLVIEDDHAANELMTQILTREGCQVENVQDGQAGLEKLIDREYDLILCDLHLPEMDGKQVYLKAKAVRPEVTGRFIFVTGGIMSEDTRNFLDETENPCIMKPFAIQALLEAISRTRARPDDEKPESCAAGPL